MKKFLVIFVSAVLTMLLLAAYGACQEQQPGSAWMLVTQAAQFSPRYGFGCLDFGGKMWVMGGDVYNPAHAKSQSYSGDYAADVWYSADGKTWKKTVERAPFNVREGFTSVEFDKKMWVIGGFCNQNCHTEFGSQQYNDVWHSTDGKKWECATTSADFGLRYGHTCVAFNNKMWVIGGTGADAAGNTGYYNDVWSSGDGATWVSVTAQAQFPARFEHTSLVLDGKMWVIAGRYYEPKQRRDVYLDDVWYSTDGANWTLATDRADFGPRCMAGGVVYNDRMWIIGGSSGGNEVWSSSDGVNWKQVSEAAQFSGRKGMGVLVHGNSMFLIGGQDESMGDRNDVWQAE